MSATPRTIKIANPDRLVGVSPAATTVPPSSMIEPSRVAESGSGEVVEVSGSDETSIPCTEVWSWEFVEEAAPVEVGGGAVVIEVDGIVVEVVAAGAVELVAPGLVVVVPGLVVVVERGVVVVVAGVVVVVAGTVVVVGLVVEVVVGTVVVVERTRKSALFLTKSLSQVLGIADGAPHAHTSAFPAPAPDGTETFAENSPPGPTGAEARIGPDLEPQRIATTVPGMNSLPDAVKAVPGSPCSGVRSKEAPAKAGNAITKKNKIAARKATIYVVPLFSRTMCLIFASSQRIPQGRSLYRKTSINEVSHGSSGLKAE